MLYSRYYSSSSSNHTHLDLWNILFLCLHGDQEELKEKTTKAWNNQFYCRGLSFIALRINKSYTEYSFMVLCLSCKLKISQAFLYLFLYPVMKNRKWYFLTHSKHWIRKTNSEIWSRLGGLKLAYSSPSPHLVLATIDQSSSFVLPPEQRRITMQRSDFDKRNLCLESKNSAQFLNSLLPNDLNNSFLTKNQQIQKVP